MAKPKSSFVLATVSINSVLVISTILEDTMQNLVFQTLTRNFLLKGETLYKVISDTHINAYGDNMRPCQQIR